VLFCREAGPESDGDEGVIDPTRDRSEDLLGIVSDLPEEGIRRCRLRKVREIQVIDKLRDELGTGQNVDLRSRVRGRLVDDHRLLGDKGRRRRRLLAYADEQYALVNEGYFEQGLDTVGDFMRFYPPSAFFRFDFWHTMHGSVARHLKNRYLQDAFDFFIKYVGSSAYDAPGFMNCLPVIQFRHDLWYVDGGLYNIANGLGKLMRELGIPVRSIRKEGKRVLGLELGDGELVDADIVVSNMEVRPTYERLLGERRSFLRKLKRFEPACSGLVIDIGLDCQYEQLAHHNFFFSEDQKHHFHSVFREKKLPEDPTVYLVAASRTDPTVAPEGCDCLKILPHIPYINERHPYTVEDYLGLKDRILRKLETMGLTDLREHIVYEQVWTPFDIQKQYYSTGGSIYGVVSNRARNFAFKAPKQSPKYENLFFAGGTVNPGGGMPMVILSGQNVARKVVAWDSR